MHPTLKRGKCIFLKKMKDPKNQHGLHASIGWVFQITRILQWN